MATRNFWLDAYIDGRANTLSGGPRSKDGGFELFVKMRDDGQPSTALEIKGYAYDDGKLKLEVTVMETNGDVITSEEIWTDR